MQPQHDRPETRPQNRSQAQVNRGPLNFPERHPYDPLKDEATRIFTHRGGLTDPRTEHY